MADASPRPPVEASRPGARRRVGTFVAPVLVIALAAALAVAVWRSGDDGATGTGEASSTDGEVEVTGARMALPFDPGQAAVYLTLTNGATDDDVLLGARAESSAIVTLHRTDIDVNGRAVMGSAGPLTVAAGSELVLEPGGTHLMLDVPDGLSVGDAYPVTLVLESGRDVTVDVAVLDPSAVSG